MSSRALLAHEIGHALAQMMAGYVYSQIVDEGTRWVCYPGWLPGKPYPNNDSPRDSAFSAAMAAAAGHACTLYDSGHTPEVILLQSDPQCVCNLHVSKEDMESLLGYMPIGREPFRIGLELGLGLAMHGGLQPILTAIRRQGFAAVTLHEIIAAMPATWVPPISIAEHQALITAHSVEQLGAHSHNTLQ